MNPEVIESNLVKSVGIIAGFCITIIALFGSIICILLGLGGSFGGILSAIGAILSLVGLSGAWVRILRKYSSMPINQIKTVRMLLIFGQFGAISLASGFLIILGFSAPIVWLTIISFFVIILFTGFFIFNATPIYFNKAKQRTP